jgi:hypothetical protein
VFYPHWSPTGRISAWNVVATVTILHFRGRGACCEGKELMPKAYTEDRLRAVFLKRGSQATYAGRNGSRITGTIRELHDLRLTHPRNSFIRVP